MEFQEAIQALSDGRVEYVVTGDLCAIFHGCMDGTYVLEICYSQVPSNIEALAAALKPFHPRPRSLSVDQPFIWEVAALNNATVLALQTDIGEVDLLAEVAGLGAFDEVKKHSITVEAFGRQIATLDLPALIRSKRAAGREKDLAALPELESLLEAD